MADLADSIDDLICAFEGNPDVTMDTLAMLIFGWILMGLFVLWLGRALYGRFILKDVANETKPKVETVAKIENKVQGDVIDSKSVVKKSAPVVSAPKGSSYVPPTPPIKKRLSRKSPVPDLKKSYFVPAPQCTGADNIAVLWVNDVFQWLYNDLVILNELLTVWLHSLNEYTKQTVSEVSTTFSWHFINIPTNYNEFLCLARTSIVLRIYILYSLQ